jgi:hypothetical protein
MKLLPVLAATLALLVGTTILHAQQPLDRGTINRWADSMLEIQRWSENQPDMDDGFDDSDPFNFESSLALAARQHGEIRRIIGRHGFSSGDQWAAVGSRIMNAYSAMHMDEESPEFQREMQQAIREIDQNPHLSAEQKEMMRNQMQMAMGMMTQMADAPAADVAAVRANRAKLDQVFDDD